MRVWSLLTQEYKNFIFFLYISSVSSMLRWFLYLTVAFRTTILSTITWKFTKFWYMFHSPQLKWNFVSTIRNLIWDKVFKKEPSKICGIQPLKNLKEKVYFRQTIFPSNFLKAVLHKFYLVYSWILCSIYELPHELVVLRKSENNKILKVHVDTT